MTRDGMTRDGVRRVGMRRDGEAQPADSAVRRSALNRPRAGGVRRPGGGVRRVVVRCRRRRDDRGSAVVEFVTLGVVLMVPLVYLVLAMGRVQAATYAADGSARAAARAFVLAPTDGDARDRARAAVRLGLRDQGFDEPDGSLDLTCSARQCLTPGGQVVATVTVDVVLPGVPGFVDGVIPVHVTVRATQVAVVDEFRPVPP
jgi:Flp pilus assembly protein TadG